MHRAKYTLALILFAILPACSGKSPSTFVAGRPMTFPIYSKGIPESLLERMKDLCRNDDDPDDETCISLSVSRKDSCLGHVPEVFETEAEYREFAKHYVYCLDAVE